MTETFVNYSYETYFKPEVQSVKPLEKDIFYFRNNWQEEGLPYNWRDLPGTGFWINTQIELLKSERKDVWLDQTEEDVKGFSLEYLAQGLTFPIFYSIEEVDGQERVVAPLYGDKLMVDTVSEEERGGLVKQTLLSKIEPYLLNSVDGSIAIMTSPSGVSGLTDPSGKEVIFPDSQTYILQKKGKEVTGFTIRTDFSEDEHREFINGLGGSLEANPIAEDILRKPIYIDGKNNNMEISDVVFSMQKTRRETSGNIFAYKNRLWDEVYLDLLRRNELWRFDERTKSLFDNFRDYVSFNHLSEEELKEALAVTILKIAESLRPGEEYRRQENISMGFILEEVQKLPGCAGGGMSLNSSGLIESLTPRVGTEKNWSFDKSGECVMCKTESDSLGPCNICKTCNDKIDAQEALASQLS